MEFFNTYFLDVIKNKYADFEGRARRKEYWMFVLCELIIFAVLGILGGILGAIADFLGIIFYTIIVLASLAIIVPSIALAVRRLHDINKSGWFYLVVLIPFVGSLIFLYFMIVEGDKTDNQYGPDPKAAERAQA